MGRFSNLEFDNREEPREEKRAEEAVRDEKHYLARARESFREGRFSDALKFYSRSLEFDARLEDAWLGQVLALLELGEPREARVWADKGLEQFPHNAELMAARGAACGRLGDLDEAAAQSDRALAEKGESPYRWRARGDMLLARKDRNEEFCFSKAMTAAGPKDAWEPLAIGRVYLHYGKFAPAVKHLEAAVERDSQSAFAWAELGRGLNFMGMADRARQAFKNAKDIDPGRTDADPDGVAEPGFFAKLKSLFRR